MARYTVVLNDNGDLTLTGNLGVRTDQEPRDDELLEAAPAQHADWLLSDDLQGELAPIADVATYDGDTNTITVRLSTPAHYQAIHDFLTEHYDMHITVDDEVVYDFDQYKHEPRNKDAKEALLRAVQAKTVPPRFKVTLSQSGDLILECMEESEKARTFLEGWPFEGSVSNVQYENNDQKATARLTTPEHYEALSGFVTEMRPSQIHNKKSLLKQIERQKNALSSSTAAPVIRQGGSGSGSTAPTPAGGGMLDRAKSFFGIGRK